MELRDAYNKILTEQEKEAIIALRRINNKEHMEKDQLEDYCNLEKWPGSLFEEVREIRAVEQLRDFDHKGLMEDIRKNLDRITTKLGVDKSTWVCSGCETQIHSDENGNLYCECHDERPSKGPAECHAVDTYYNGTCRIYSKDNKISVVDEKGRERHRCDGIVEAGIQMAHLLPEWEIFTEEVSKDMMDKAARFASGDFT